MGGGPVTEHDWTIHSINIHGLFFERWCENVVANAPGWKVKSTNYPVEYPPPNGPWRGKESALDIRAEFRHGEDILSLIIECKKHNPEFVNWIFFPRVPSIPSGRASAYSVSNSMEPDTGVGWIPAGAVAMLRSTLIGADDGREVRSGYLQSHKGDKTKTSNAAISDAAYQVALAIQSIFFEEMKFSKTLGSANPSPGLPYRKLTILPVIVTSAHIFVCEFDPADVDPSTGEIPYAKATIKEVPNVSFQYPLPRHLQGKPASLADALSTGQLHQFTHMGIIVTHSEAFPEFLDTLVQAQPKS